jgi:hypothetical protein
MVNCERSIADKNNILSDLAGRCNLLYGMKKGRPTISHDARLACCRPLSLT